MSALFSKPKTAQAPVLPDSDTAGRSALDILRKRQATGGGRSSTLLAGFDAGGQYQRPRGGVATLLGGS